MGAGGWNVVATAPAPSSGDGWNVVSATPSLDTSNAAGEGTYQMLGPAGKVQVPYSKVRGAQSQNYQLQGDDQQRYNKDSGNTPGFVSRALAETPLPAIAHAAIQTVAHPVDTAHYLYNATSDSNIQRVMDAVPQAAKAKLSQLKQVKSDVGSGNVAGAVNDAVSAIPVLGPFMQRTADNPDRPATTGSYLTDLKNTVTDPGTMGAIAGFSATAAPAAAQALTTLGGGALLSTAADAVPDAIANPINAIPGVPAAIKTAVQNAAVGDRDAAALRGLRVPNGKGVISAQQAVQTARPYLQGASSLEDLQSRLGAAKQEVFAPYQEALDKAGSTPVHGPDGPSTLAALEDERQQLSAMNRGLRNGDPSALQLAQQKGLTQADSLAREQAIRNAIDPVLQSHGIDPQAIRANYAALGKVQNLAQGRSTLLEKPSPYGLGKLANFDVTKPLKDIGSVGSAIRDIIAGRPLVSGSAMDLGIKEGFAGSYPKPNLGTFTPPQSVEPAIAGLLPESTVGEEGGANYSSGPFPQRPSVVTPAPPSPLGLPASATAGDAQPMVAVRAPAAYPQLNAAAAANRTLPTQFAAPSPIAAALRTVTPVGEVLPPVRGLLDAGPLTGPVVDPSTNDLIRAIKRMRQNRGKAN